MKAQSVFNKEDDIPMLEVHMDVVCKYDTNNIKSLPKLGPYGGNTRWGKSITTFDQDKTMFRSSQCNELCWKIYGVTIMGNKGLGVRLMTSAMFLSAFGFGTDIRNKYLWEINMLRDGINTLMRKVHKDHYLSLQSFDT